MPIGGLVCTFKSGVFSDNPSGCRPVENWLMKLVMVFQDRMIQWNMMMVDLRDRMIDNDS